MQFIISPSLLNIDLKIDFYSHLQFKIIDKIFGMEL